MRGGICPRSKRAACPHRPHPHQPPPHRSRPDPLTTTLHTQTQKHAAAPYAPPALSPLPPSSAGIVKLFRGHVAQLLRQPFGADVVMDLYDVAATAQRNEMCAEFYGREFVLFDGVGGQAGGLASLRQLLDAGAAPAKRRAIMQHMTKALAPIMEKAILHPPITHRWGGAGHGAGGGGLLLLQTCAQMWAAVSRRPARCPLLRMTKAVLLHPPAPAPVAAAHHAPCPSSHHSSLAPRCLLARQAGA